MWVPAKSAFRAGLAGTTTWHDTNIGNYSCAGGEQTQADGIASFFLENRTGFPACFAYGQDCLAVGNQSTADGDWAYAIGRNASAIADQSVAVGFYLENTGAGSFLIGSGTSTGTGLFANSKVHVIKFGTQTDKATMTITPKTSDTGPCGLVGIGVDNPVLRLEVSGGLVVGANYAGTIPNTIGGTGGGSKVFFEDDVSIGDSAATCITMVGCQKSVTSPPVVLTPSGNSIRGTLVMYDEFRRKQADCSIATVTITNGKSIYTDSVSVDGKWEILDVPAGIYTVTASSPGFNGLNFSGNDTHQGVQYVGQDVLDLYEFQLGKDLDSSFVSNGTVSITWRYYRRGEDTTAITDSSAIVTLRFETMNADWNQYYMSLTTSPTASCKEKLVFAGCSPTVAGNSVTVVDDYNMYYATKEKYGKSAPPLLYIQVPPVWSKRSPDGNPDPEECLSPLVIPVQF